MFDYSISNPPYQVDKTTEFNNSANNIFHLFYQHCVEVSECVIMIFPGGRWMQRSTKGSQAAQVIYPTITSLDFYPNGNEKNIHHVFPSVRIADGLAVVHAQCNTPGDVIMLNSVPFIRPVGNDILPLSSTMAPVARKILNRYDHFVTARKYPRMFFGFPSYFVERNPEVVHTEPHEDSIVAYLANDQKGVSKRVQRFYMNREYASLEGEKEQVYHHYKVCSSQANTSKNPRYTTYSVVENDSVVGESWVIVGEFPTKEEAQNYCNYLDTHIVRLLLDESKGGKLKTWGYFVPDLIDYTDNNENICWDQPLEEQLHDLFGLTEEEKLMIRN